MIYGTQILNEIERKRMQSETKLLAALLIVGFVAFIEFLIILKFDDKLADARQFCIKNKMKHEFCINYFNN